LRIAGLISFTLAADDRFGRDGWATGRSIDRQVPRRQAMDPAWDFLVLTRRDRHLQPGCGNIRNLDIRRIVAHG